MRNRIVIADDITGASGIGTLFSSNNLEVKVYFEWAKNYHEDLDILVIDTDSRFDTSDKAYEKVYELTKKLKNLGNDYFFHKTCTVFRGNVGSECDAILDATGEENAYLVAGFPDNLRTVVDSIGLVDGIPAAKSHYAKDPMNPITESNLVKAFEKESTRKAVGFSLKDLRKDLTERRKRLEELESQYDVIIFDVETNDDLEKITEMIYQKKVIGGSSALGRNLGKRILSKNFKVHNEKIEKKSLGILGISASITPKTKKQIDYLRKSEIEVLSISPYKIYHEPKILENLIKEITKKIKRGQSMMIHTANSEAEIQSVDDLFFRENYSKKEQSFIITNFLAEIAFKVKENTNLNRFFVAGGDTSASFCKKLDIDGFKILEEIDIGLSSVCSLTDSPNLMILKSGNFGSNDFILKAFNYLSSY